MAPRPQATERSWPQSLRGRGVGAASRAGSSWLGTSIRGWTMLMDWLETSPPRSSSRSTALGRSRGSRAMASWTTVRTRPRRGSRSRSSLTRWR